MIRVTSTVRKMQSVLFFGHLCFVTHDIWCLLLYISLLSSCCVRSPYRFDSRAYVKFGPLDLFSFHLPWVRAVSCRFSFRSVMFLPLSNRLASLQAALILLQPDPKASHAEVSIALDGVSHKVCFSIEFISCMCIWLATFFPIFWQVFPYPYTFPWPM